MPALKIFNGTIFVPRTITLDGVAPHSQCRAMVITTSQAKAAKLADISVGYLREYWGPGQRLGHLFPDMAYDVLYIQPLNARRGDPWVKVDR